MMSKARKEKLAYVEAHCKASAESKIGKKVRTRDPGRGRNGRPLKPTFPLPLDIPPQCIGTVTAVNVSSGWSPPANTRTTYDFPSKYELVIKWGKPVRRTMRITLALYSICLREIEDTPKQQPPP
jgi:hypothetical protein